MNKVLIDLNIPFINKELSVLIPLDCKIFIVTQMISAIVSEQYKNNFSPRDDVVLCWRDSGEILNTNLTAEQLNIENGTRLILM